MASGNRKEAQLRSLSPGRSRGSWLRPGFTNGIHHIRETGNELAWDLAFLGFGALLVVGGWLLARSDERR